MLINTNSQTSKDIIAGIIVFFSVFYILPLNASILSDANGANMNFNAVYIGTALLTALASISMGLYTKLPLIISTGIGINFFFSYSLCGNLNYSWQQSLLIIFVASILFFMSCLLPIRKKIIECFSVDLASILTSCVGVFIIIIGLKNAEIITENFELGNFEDNKILLTLFGIIITFIFNYINIKRLPKLTQIFNTYAILFSMIITASILYFFGDKINIENVTQNVQQIQFAEFFNTYNNVKISPELFSIFYLPKTYAIILSLVIFYIIDSLGTIIALYTKLALFADGKISKQGEKSLLVDSGVSIFSPLLLTSPPTIFLESNISIQSGAKTGLTSIVVGILFLLSIFVLNIFPFFSLFFSPIITTAALIIIGEKMFICIKNINYKDNILLITTLVMVITLITTETLTNGIGVSFICYSLLMLCCGRKKEVHKFIFIISFLYILYYIINYNLQ